MTATIDPDLDDFMRATREESRRGGANGQAGKDTAEPFPFWRVADIEALEPPEYIVEGLIPAQAQSVLFAPSGHYKTMTALDLVVCIAFDLPFHGLAVKTCPVIYVANEDAYSLARQRLLGLLDFRGLKGERERIAIIPGDVSLSDPAVVERLAATAEAAFPGENVGFVFDTWDKSIGGDPDRTAEVVPAVERLEQLIRRGARFVVTLSHSPWSNPERTKGSVAYWAAQGARIKAERDEETGKGTLYVIHMKNGPDGLRLEFEYQKHPFTVGGKTCETIIPHRLHDAPDRTPKASKHKSAKRLGKNQKIALDALKAAIVDHPDPTPAARDIPRHAQGVGMEKWRAAFDRYSPHVEPKHRATRFQEAVDALAAERFVRHVEGFSWVP
jgi:hypothetical protein